MSSASLTTPTARQSQALPDRRTLGPWFVAEFCVSYASMLLIVGCYDYAERVLGASPSQRLWISASWGFAYIFVSVLGGRVAEKFGPRRASATLAALAIVACLVGLVLYAFPVWWLVPVVMLPVNLTTTMMWPALESGLTRSPGKLSLSNRMSVYNIAWGSAGFLGTFTHGMLEHLSFVTIFVVPAVVCGLAAITLGVFAVPAEMISVENVPDSAAGEHELDDPAVRRRAKLALNIAWIANPLAYVAIYALIPLMTQLAKRAGVTDLSWAGVVGSTWFVARFFTFALAGRWTGWHYKLRWLIGPLAALTASLVGMLVVPNLAALIGFQIVFGFSAAMLYSASLYYSMHVSSGHGSHAAFHEAVIGIGIMAGPMIGAVAATGKLDDGAMMRIALSVGALLLAGLAGVGWLAGRSTKDS